MAGRDLRASADRAGPPAQLRETRIGPGESQDSSRIRRPAEAASRGLGLRLKIMLAMGLVTLVVALLIFIVVYVRAARALDEQINARGKQMVDVLASVDSEYWMASIHAHHRAQLFGDLMQHVRLTPNAQDNPEYFQLRRILVEPLSADRALVADQLIDRLSSNPDWKAEVQANPRMRQNYEILVNPFRSFHELRPFKRLEELAGKDLIDVGVFDVTLPKEAYLPGVGMRGVQNVNLPEDARQPGFSMSDKSRVEQGATVMTRTFVRNPDPGDPVRLLYMVQLSTQAITEAKRSLLLIILLPILGSFGIALGIAAWLSQRIVKPVKTLIGDIHEVSSGNVDHKTAATSNDEIGLLAAAFNRMTTALRVARQQELEKRALEHELDIAGEIQANLIPKKKLSLPDYDIDAYYRPSKEVGGDYYDFIDIDRSHFGVVVADVSGKGVPGSLVMAMARALIRMEAERSANLSPADTLVRVNRMLARDIKKGMFVTVMYVIMDPSTHQVRLSSAGHNPMIVWHARTGAVSLRNPKGIALGIDPGPIFERSVSEETLTLEPGDRVILYTDGAVEAMNENNQEFGDRRFQELCKKLATLPSAQFLERIVKALDEHKGRSVQHDDITVLTLRRL
ncbi:MAG: SpoIIE family protein phosphatase [Planctomycetes bacterium]|nr:SpoIIE family protein phosphatase [Planctomycetota bacterium]